MEQFVETEWCGATLRISTGKLAQQANGSVLLSKRRHDYSGDRHDVERAEV